MSCFNLPETNRLLRPIGVDHFLSSHEYDRYFKEVGEEKTLEGRRKNRGLTKLSRIPEYSKNPKISNLRMRILVLALSVLAVIVLLTALLATLQFQGFCLTLPAITVVMGLPILLMTGGLWVLFRLRNKVDLLAGTVIQPFGERKWAAVSVNFLPSYLDISTLDNTQSGIALAYIKPPALIHRVPIFIFSLMVQPVLVISKIVYNTIRFVVIPFYIISQMLKQAFSKKEIAQEDRFILKDIAREMARSLANILKAPFYSTAALITVFYGLLDPMAGRVAYSCVERDWNDDVVRSRGIWVYFPQRYFNFEGGGDRLGLGQHSYYSLGCTQPIGVFLFDKGKIVSGGRTSMQFLPKPTPLAFMFENREEDWGENE